MSKSKSEEDKRKKKQQQSLLEAQIIAFMQKAAEAALKAALKEISKSIK